jgi:hypothetical protein
MRITLRVTFLNGETKEVVCSASDLVKFENHFNISVSKIDQDLKISYLLFLVHAAEFRTKATTLDFESWLESVESVGASEVANPK